MTKLNPCPDCGCEPDFEKIGSAFRVACWRCYSTEYITARSASGTINAWNAATGSEQAAPTEKTLRDEFAMAALAGILAYPGCDYYGSAHNNGTPESVAMHAYVYADAMLKESSK